VADQKVNEDQQKKNEAAKAQLAASQEAQAKTREGQEAAAGSKPTPTQEENDLAKLGAYVPEHEPDGSPEQPPGPQAKQETRHLGADRPGGYQTRAARPTPATENK
jgi:hypothetical protein